MLLASTAVADVVSLRLALWLLDRPVLSQSASVKRLAGHLLKQPARAGSVQAQSRLGRLLCRDCDGARDQRIGVQLLLQAAKAGDCQARLALRLLPDKKFSYSGTAQRLN